LLVPATVLLSGATDAESVVPALGVLRHQFVTLPMDPGAVHQLKRPVVVLVDGRRDPIGARAMTRLLRSSDHDHVVLAVVSEGGTAGMNADWEVDDFLVDSAAPGEVDARLRLAGSRLDSADDSPDTDAASVVHGSLRIEPVGRTVTVDGGPVPLTYLEYELLSLLARHPNRVFNRDQIMARVWGRAPDERSPSRTVDVHVRRVRAALGEHAEVIRTVRRVGYKFVPEFPPPRAHPRTPAAARDTSGSHPPAQSSPPQPGCAATPGALGEAV
jgi:DNA-binding response OmpR family regulator